MTDLDLRKHTRKNERAVISFGYLNQTPRHLGIVENTSRYGIYFITEKMLTVGTIVIIQPWRCGTRPPETSSAYSRREADAICEETHNASHQLNALVIGKVVHCRRLENHLPSAYGVGAHYESPSV
jgi:hypothetical protein